MDGSSSHTPKLTPSNSYNIQCVRSAIKTHNEGLTSPPIQWLIWEKEEDIEFF